MGFLSFTGKQGRMLPRRERGHRSAFRTPSSGTALWRIRSGTPWFFAGFNSIHFGSPSPEGRILWESRSTHIQASLGGRAPR